MFARTLSINDELIGIFDMTFIPIARNVPHDNPITGFDGLATNLDILVCDTPHVCEWCLPSNDLRHHVRNQLGIGF